MSIDAYADHNAGRKPLKRDTISAAGIPDTDTAEVQQIQQAVTNHREGIAVEPIEVEEIVLEGDDVPVRLEREDPWIGERFLKIR